jgi:primary-amine oxidase
VHSICFVQDGTIGYEIKLTGELSTNPISEGEDPLNPTHGTLVLPGVNAQHHQHMFCMRLDMAVDDTAGGQGLMVSEVSWPAIAVSPPPPPPK